MRRLALGILLLSVGPAGLALAQQAPSAASGAEDLARAAYAGQLELVRSTIEGGVPVDAADAEGHTPLMWAAFNGHTHVVSHLLEKGAAIDATDENGRTALMYASSGPFAETVELLLEKGAEVNTQGTLEGFTALMTAAAEGQDEVVWLLLSHGADPSLEDVDGDTAESFAREKGHRKVLELLQKPPPLVRKAG